MRCLEEGSKIQNQPQQENAFGEMALELRSQCVCFEKIAPTQILTWWFKGTIQETKIISCARGSFPDFFVLGVIQSFSTVFL